MTYSLKEKNQGKRSLIQLCIAVRAHTPVQPLFMTLSFAGASIMADTIRLHAPPTNMKPGISQFAQGKRDLD